MGRGHKYNKDGNRGGEGGPLRGCRDDAGRASGQGERPRAALAPRWSRVSRWISGAASNRAGVRWEVDGSRLAVGVRAALSKGQMWLVSITKNQWD